MSLIVDVRKKLGSFELESKFEAQNGVTCLLGPSGCGKSMTLKCIAGIEKPDEGYIELDGVVLYDSAKGINLPPQKRRVGYLFQNYALFPNMTVRQNILCGMRHIRDKSEKEEKLKKMLDMFQLGGLENHRPAQLSGGQRQALTLLMASLQTPKLLLLDEHTAALDPGTAKKVLELSDKIISENKLTALMITHNMSDAIRHGNRLIMMDRGRIVLDISGEEKSRLTKADLLERFAEKAGVQEETDSVLLS